MGSVSTNVVVIDAQGRVLAKRYLPTAGRPIEAVKQGLAEVGAELGRRVTIQGVVPGGWRFDGRVDWVTSWGLAEVLLLGGATADGEVVAVLIPAVDQPGLASTGELRLAAMSGAHNVALRLDGLRVSAADVALQQPRIEWLATDRMATANVTPAVFGLLATICARLTAVSRARDSAAGLDLAAALTAEAAELRDRGYALLDDVPPAERLAERLAVRGSALELVNRAAAALVVAGAGTSMLATSPTQRLAREALFHLVQASTPPMREAVLSRMAGRPAAMTEEAD